MTWGQVLAYLGRVVEHDRFGSPQIAWAIAAFFVLQFWGPGGAVIVMPDNARSGSLRASICDQP
jgi:hypothetical protein